jgi:AAA15 family ATPase/GTPase
MNLKQLTIKNFRCFDKLEIECLSKINLFVGKNNSGKSSILESLFLLFGMSNPKLANIINILRGVGNVTPNHLSYLFHNLKLRNKPSFYCKFDNDAERWLDIEPYMQNEKNIVNVDSSLTSNLYSEEIGGVNFNFSIHEAGKIKSQYKSSLIYKSGLWEIKNVQQYEERTKASFISSTNIPNDKNTLEAYSNIIKRNDKVDILGLLKIFDPNIENIQILHDGIYFKIKDIDVLTPINIMGEGIRRFLAIITAVALFPHSFVCIDEIENGLNYLSYKLLLKSLLLFSNQYDVQLFITTHNIEVLSCLKSLLEKGNNDINIIDMQKHTKVFTIGKTLKAGYQAYGYSFEAFKDAINNETEIRS